MNFAKCLFIFHYTVKMSLYFKNNYISASQKNRASILAAVLGMIALASFVVLAFMEEATAKIKYSGLFQNRDELRVEAHSHLQAAMAVLREIQEIDRGLYAPVQGWSDPIGYAQIPVISDLKVGVKIEDETGKISLAQATPLILNTLFEEIGIPFSEAEPLTDCLLDWIDNDSLTRLNGAELEYYKRQNPSYKPANTAIKNWDELFLIKDFDSYFLNEDGTPNQLFDQFKSAVSLYHNEPLNLNTATPLALAVVTRVEGFDTQAIYDYLKGDDEQVGTVDDQLINSRSHLFYPQGLNPRNSMAGLLAQVLKISIQVSRGDSSFLLTAIVSNQNTSTTSESNSREQDVKDEGNTTDGLNDQDKSGQLALNNSMMILLLTENSKI